MKPPSIPWPKVLLAVGLSAAAGVLLILLGAVFQVPTMATVGGALLTPGLVVAGGACMLVVLMVPIWPISALAEKVPPWARWPFVAAAIVIAMAWWALWASIALGDHLSWWSASASMALAQALFTRS